MHDEEAFVNGFGCGVFSAVVVVGLIWMVWLFSHYSLDVVAK